MNVFITILKSEDIDKAISDALAAHKQAKELDAQAKSLNEIAKVKRAAAEAIDPTDTAARAAAYAEAEKSSERARKALVDANNMKQYAAAFAAKASELQRQQDENVE